jgi:hypothetical protein
MFSFPLKAMVSGFWFFAHTSKGGEGLAVLLLLQVHTGGGKPFQYKRKLAFRRRGSRMPAQIGSFGALQGEHSALQRHVSRNAQERQLRIK